MATTRRHASDYFEVDLDPAAQRVIITRLGRTFESRVAAEEACRPVLDVLRAIDRASHTLLMDARLAVRVNDPAYEEWYAPFRHQIVSGFARAAVLVRTASGRIQVSRLTVADRLERTLAIFSDMAEANDYLDERR